MNDERMPISLYKLDSGYNDKVMNGNDVSDYLYCSIRIAGSKSSQDS